MLWQFVVLLVAHFVGDFLLQTHWQASNKSKRNDALVRHVAIYTGTIAVAAVLLFGGGIDQKNPPSRLEIELAGLAFAAVNGVLHFATDYLTSRWSARLWARQEWHNFFVVIGLDQLIHHLTLAATLALFTGALNG